MVDHYHAVIDQSLVEIKVPHDGADASLIQIQLVWRYTIFSLQGEIMHTGG